MVYLNVSGIAAAADAVEAADKLLDVAVAEVVAALSSSSGSESIKITSEI